MRRVRDESGFTLVELLTTVLVVGALLAIAVPAYIGLAQGARTAGGKANVRSAMPAAEEMSATNGDYAGISGATLRDTAAGISPAVKAVAVHSNLGYCIQDTETGGAPFFDFVGGDPGPYLQPGFSAAKVQAGTCLQAVGVPAS